MSIRHTLCQEGQEHAAPQADPDEGATALVGRRMHIDMESTIPQDQANPDGHPRAEVEPKQDNR